MNLKYLGDALDHWKGSLLDYLTSSGVCGPFIVDPMCTDGDTWLESDYQLYARFLRVDRAAVLTYEPDASTSWRLSELDYKGDVFLDPDTGIMTGRVKDRDQYTSAEEIVRLLSNGFDRTVAVYQHVRAQATSSRVDRILIEFPWDIPWVSYESGTVAMLFFTFNPDKNRAIHNSLRSMLGRHANARVRAGRTRVDSPLLYPNRPGDIVATLQ